MKIGAYQFQITGDIASNFQEIKRAVLRASRENIRILAFPECSLTGYPPHDIASSSLCDFEQAALCCDELDKLAKKHEMYIVMGAVMRENDNYYNSAIVFTPTQERYVYQKRALWGWDRDNFRPGNQTGVFEADGIKIGIRICFEIRFPEYFRELYREGTDLNIVMFYDISDNDDIARYDLIKAHIRTRAVENVCYTLSVNAAGPYQTAPTAIYDRSGNTLVELKRNTPGLLVYDLVLPELDFGECGRKEISDIFQKGGGSYEQKSQNDSGQRISDCAH